MNPIEDNNQKEFKIKIIQSGKIKSFLLNEDSLNKSFIIICKPLMKQLKLNKKDIFFTNVEGKALNNYDLNLPLIKIIENFGYQINLYSEKII